MLGHPEKDPDSRASSSRPRRTPGHEAPAFIKRLLYAEIERSHLGHGAAGKVGRGAGVGVQRLMSG